MLIKLTSVGHPDIDGGVGQAIYIEANRVLAVGRARIAQSREGAYEEHQQALARLTQEIERVGGDISRMRINFEDPDQASTIQQLRDQQVRLHNTHMKLMQITSGPFNHPRFNCTEVCLACGTVEHSVMLSRHYVSETPDEVYVKLQSKWAPA